MERAHADSVLRQRQLEVMHENARIETKQREAAHMKVLKAQEIQHMKVMEE